MEGIAIPRLKSFTLIEWAFYTFNCWRGCSEVNTLCSNCYARTERSVLMHGAHWGPACKGGTRIAKSESGWKLPLSWNRTAKKAGERRRVFCASLADVFEIFNGAVTDCKGNVLSVTLDEQRTRLFDLIDQTPWLDWLLLTKRPQNIRKLWLPRKDGTLFRPNVWLGTSVGTQRTYDRWTPRLLACRDLAPILFLSIEPLLEKVDMGAIDVDWAIVGGESGKNARNCKTEWIRSVRDQCRAANVPVFVKQLGRRSDLPLVKHKKGGDPAEWPRFLRVRQLPKTARS